jgi:predicted RNase H-like HicB family nuclease
VAAVALAVHLYTVQSEEPAEIRLSRLPWPGGWYPRTMRNEFSAVVERDDDWYVAYALEVPGANGQGRTREEALESLRNAVALILSDRREDALRGVPSDAERATVVVE